MSTTYAELASNVRANQTTLSIERSELNRKLQSLAGRVENRDPNDAEAAQIRSFTARKAELDEQYEDLEVSASQFEREAKIEAQNRAEYNALPQSEQVQRDRKYSDGIMGSEPIVYSPGTAREGVSFFRDMYSLSQGHDREAFDRQNRYQDEQAVERSRADSRHTTRAASTGSFAGLVPPTYLVDQAALVARAGRPIANAAFPLPLPPNGGMSLIIPKGTTGASAAVQSSENSAVSNTDEVFGNITLPVATIAGQQDVSRQSLERGTPGIDSLIFMDIAAAYAVALDSQAISGTGSSGQMLGILATSGGSQSSAFVAAVTIATFFTKVAGQISAITTNRLLAPDVIFMHPRRWSWLTSLLDTTSRPLVNVNTNAMNSLATFDQPVDTSAGIVVGTMLGLPVILDANLPTAVGSGPEDVVIVARRADLLIFEDGDGSPTDLRFEQTLGNQLTIKLVAYGYAAFTAARFPTGFGVVGGNSGAGFGLITPVF